MKRKGPMRTRAPALRQLAVCGYALLALSAVATFPTLAHADVDAGSVEYYDAMPGVKLAALSSTASSTGMVVHAGFANSTSVDQSVYYRVVWLDASGQPVATRQPWNVISVKGNADQIVSMTTDNSKAAKYRLQVSLGKHF
jgi:uncharacterized protein YcfL